MTHTKIYVISVARLARNLLAFSGPTGLYDPPEMDSNSDIPVSYFCKCVHTVTSKRTKICTCVCVRLPFQT